VQKCVCHFEFIVNFPNFYTCSWLNCTAILLAGLSIKRWNEGRVKYTYAIIPTSSGSVCKFSAFRGHGMHALLLLTRGNKDKLGQLSRRYGLIVWMRSLCRHFASKNSQKYTVCMGDQSVVDVQLETKEQLNKLSHVKTSYHQPTDTCVNTLHENICVLLSHLSSLRFA